MTSPVSATPRQRRRWGRTLLIIVIGLAALIVVALALAPSLLNLEQIKDKVVNSAEQQLNRDVELGQVRLEFLNGLGLGLEQLTIANSEGWQSPHFVKVGTLSIKVALLPLLSRKIEVSKVILNEGEIVIERDDQGRYNYDDLSAMSADATETPKPADPQKPPEDTETPTGTSPLAGLLVSKLALHNISVISIDQMAVPGETVTTSVRLVNLEADNIGLNTPIDLALSLALFTDGDANVRLNGRAGPIPDNANVDVHQIPLQFTLKTTDLQLAPIVPYLGDQPALTAGELGTDITLQGALGKTLDIKGQLSPGNAVMPDHTGQGQPTTLPAVTLNHDLTVDLANALLKMTDIRADLGALQATLQGTVQQFHTSPLLDLRLNLSKFAIAEAINQWPMLATALPETLKAEGNIALQTTLKGTPERLHAISQLDAQPLSIRLSDGTAVALSQVQFSHDATIDRPQSLLTLTQAKLDLDFLQTTVQGTIAAFDSTPQLDLQVETSNFNPVTVLTQLPMLAETLPQPTDLQGDLQLQATLKGTPDNLQTDARVTSKALFLKSGSFHGDEAAKGGMRMDLAQMQTAFKAQLNAPNPPSVKADIKAKRLVFDQQSAEAPAAAPSPGKDQPPAPDAPAAPPVNLRGNVALAEGSITGIDFQNLKAVFSILNGLVKSQQTVQMFGGAYQGNLSANLAQAKPDYQFEIKLAEMQAGEVTSAPNILFGRLNTDLKFSGKGFDWEGISTTLTGSGKLKLNDFKLTTLDVMPKLAKSLSAVSTVAGFTVPDDLSTRSFDKVRATLRIKEGKIHSDDLQLWGPDVQLLGEGLIGLDSSLAFDGTAVLLGKLAKSLGKRAKFLMDQEGRINIPLAIQGTVTQPQIALNEKHLTDLAQRALTQQVKDKAGKKAKKILDQILPGAKTDDKPGDSPSPFKELDKTLKGLFNR